MRAAVTALLLLALAASSQAAGVRLTVRGDGRKVITNFGGAGGVSGHDSDLSWLARQHDRRSEYDAIIEREAARWNIDPVLVRAVIQVESNFNPACVSSKGARGLMQLMPETGRRYGAKQLHDPEQNIRAGVHYLADLLRMFRNDLHHALAAYNAGENAVTRYGGIPPYNETMQYVKRALTVYYGAPYGQQPVMFAGRRGPKTLRGGFGTKVLEPLAATLLPGAKFLGMR